MFKNIILGCILTVGVISGFQLVFSTSLIFTPDVKVSTTISPNIYLGDPVLSSTIIGYDSNIDISKASIRSSCNTQSQFLERFDGVYYFSLTYIGNDCRNKNIVLELDEQTLVSSVSTLRIVKKSEIMSLLTDYPTKNLQDLYNSLQSDIKKYTLFKKLNSSEIGKYISYRKRQRIFQESSYQSEILTTILTGRSQKYISPVPGRTVSKQFSQLPNAGRPYRETYTDWIHQGWDISADLWDDVVALDDGVIVRVVSGFEFSDLSDINYGPTLTEEDKLKNLDTLRWNQVWLKTTKWEIIFYSHLGKVYDYIKEWDIVQRQTPLGTIGVSGIPEEWYQDYHLHFEIQINPYNIETAGTYDFVDYMKWDWKFRGETFEYIIANQTEIFQ